MPRPFLSQLLSTAHMKQEMKFESEKSPEKPEEIVLYTTPTPLLEHSHGRPNILAVKLGTNFYTFDHPQRVVKNGCLAKPLGQVGAASESFPTVPWTRANSKF